MESELKTLVLEHGFEAIFNALKAIVGAEYERAKRDFEFLQALTAEKKSEVVEEVAVVAEESTVEEAKEAEAVDEDTKKIEIAVASGPVKSGRKFFKKGVSGK